MDKYDVVIVGAGIGGLISAAVLAKRGYSVGVFEKEPNAGGLCASFVRQQFKFDAAVDSIGGLNQGDLLWKIFNELDLWKDLELIRLSPIRRNIFPDLTIDIPADKVKYINLLQELFPQEKENIIEFFTQIEKIYIESTTITPNILPIISKQLQSAIEKNYEQFLNDYIDDFRLKAILASYCNFVGLPANQASALVAINTLMHYLKGGAFRIKGGMQSLVDALVRKIKKCSGEIFLNEEVIDISVENQKAKYVKTEQQRVVSADFVIAAIDMRTVLNEIIKPGKISNTILGEINALEISSSFIIVYIATDLDIAAMNLPSSIGYFPFYNYESMLNNNNDFSFGLSIPSLDDKTLCPKGQNIVILHLPLAGSEISQKEEIVSKLISEVEKRLLPGLAKHILFKFSADRETISKYTGNVSGAAYGWKQTPELFRNINLFRKLLDNLYFAGHWSGYGGGVMAAAFSALKTVQGIEHCKARISA